MAGSISKTSYYYKLYRVTRKGGKVTTVSMDPVLAVRAAQALGGPDSVSQLVREAAADFEATDNMRHCSHYVQQRVKDALAKALALRNEAKVAQPTL